MFWMICGGIRFCSMSEGSDRYGEEAAKIFVVGWALVDLFGFQVRMWAMGHSEVNLVFDSAVSRIRIYLWAVKVA